ncbi:MAG: tetratricopeptide repeat protein [Gemmatimonadales bacterium]
MLLLCCLAAPLAAQQGIPGQATALARAGNLDSALVLLSQARSTDPNDPDLQLAHAKVLGWAGQKRDAVALYDTMLTRNPGNADARVGLGYVYHWQGRERAASGQADSALALDSTNADALALRRAIRAATRGTMESSANWSNDSDHNTNFWQTHSVSIGLSDGLRLLGSVAVLEASDPVRDAWRYGGEAGLRLAIGALQASALAGARRLEPDQLGGRTAATYRGSLRWHPDSRLGLGAGYARYPFDDTALLIGLDLDVESLEGGFDAHPASGLVLTGGGGALWISDGNRRTEAQAAITQDLSRRFTVGVSGRALGYRTAGFGYFSPDRFHLLEGTVAVKVGNARWDGQLDGGLGAQQIGRNGDTQSEWRIEARVGKNWGNGNRAEGFGKVTNSAVSSTTGAFRYRTAGVVLRLGL